MLLSGLSRVVRVFASAIVITSLLVPTAARAAGGPTKEQCMSANEDASVLRKRGRLLSARTSLATCSSSTCPQVVRDDCAKAMSDIALAIPSIRFEAFEGTTELDDVRVLMDGVPIFERLGGKVVELDPGEHVFAILAKGHPTELRTLTIKEGEKDRVERITYAPPVVAPVAARLVVLTEPGAGIFVDRLPVTLGRFEGLLTPGGHEVRVSKNGKVPASFNIDMKSGETQMNVALLSEKSTLLPWIIGGAVVVGAFLIGGGIVLAATK